MSALTLLGITQYERISLESGEADAHRRVTYYSTVRVNTAGTWTRIAALLTDARQVRGTLAVADAFRSTVRRIADKFRQARARGCVVYDLASTVQSTRGWIAWINWGRRLHRCSGTKKQHEEQFRF